MTREIRRKSCHSLARKRQSVEHPSTEDYFYTCKFMGGMTWGSNFQLIRLAP